MIIRFIYFCPAHQCRAILLGLLTYLTHVRRWAFRSTYSTLTSRQQQRRKREIWANVLSLADFNQPAVL